jgi:hypothetical protein
LIHLKIILSLLSSLLFFTRKIAFVAGRQPASGAVSQPGTQVLLSSSQFPVTHGSPLPVQAPLWQVSVPVQNMPSSVHEVPSGTSTSAGQVVLVPLHCSATSHSPVAARHSVPELPAGCVHTLLPLH